MAAAAYVVTRRQGEKRSFDVGCSHNIFYMIVGIFIVLALFVAAIVVMIVDGVNWNIFVAAFIMLFPVGCCLTQWWFSKGMFEPKDDASPPV